MEGKVFKIVNDVQMGRCSEVKATTLMTKIYDETDNEEFTKYFCQITIGFLQENYISPYVKKVLEFLAKFVAHIATITSTAIDEVDDEPPDCLFLGNVIEQIISYHNDLNKDCRFNICSFISTTLQNIGNKVYVNAHLIELIQEAMFDHLQDLKFSIRLQAALALTRFQSPHDPNCPVVEALTVCLRDSNPLVRRCVIQKIGLSPVTLVELQKKVRDVDAKVRLIAFKRLADIGFRYLKIIQRQHVLKSGFMETDRQVKKIFTEYLITKWLTFHNDSYLAFLTSIRLDADEVDIENTEELSTQLLDVFFKTQPINNLIQALPLNSDKLIPENDLQTELGLYWKIVVKYLRQSDDLEIYLEQIIPELIIFCGYIERLITKKFSGQLEEWENLSFNYLLYHLFDIVADYDLSEEIGRKTLDKLIKKCLKTYRFQTRLLNKLIQIGSKLAPNIESFTNEVYNIIFDIWQPFKTIPQDSNDYNFRLAQLKLKLNLLEDELEEAIKSENFLKSHSIKTEIDNVRKKKETLSQEGSPVEVVRVVTEDPEKLVWCLDLLCALLKHGNIATLYNSLIECRDTFLIPLMASKHIEIQWRALTCLGLYCIYDETFARCHYETFYISILSSKVLPDFNKKILINAIFVTTDLIRMHGPDWFNYENGTNSPPSSSSSQKNGRLLYNEEEEDGPSINQNQNLKVDCVIRILVDMLDDEDDEIRDASLTSISKLILNGFPVNSTLMSRLFLKWLNPSTQKSFQHKLGAVLKKYVNLRSEAKAIVINSIVSILTNIANAPKTSPLADINLDTVVQVLAFISDSGNSKGLMHMHTELSRILVEEISSTPDEKVTIYFAKMLNFLNVNNDQSPTIREIVTKAELILERETLQRLVTVQLKKFLTRLKQGPNTTTNTSATLNSNSVNLSDVRLSNNKNQTSTRSVENRRLSTVSEGVTCNENDGNQAGPKRIRVNVDVHIDATSQPEQNTEVQQSTTNQNKSSSESDIIPSSQPVAVLVRDICINLTKLDVENAKGAKATSDSEMNPPPAKLQRLELRGERINRSPRNNKAETSKNPGNGWILNGKDNMEKQSSRKKKDEDERSNTNSSDANTTESSEIIIVSRRSMRNKHKITNQKENSRAAAGKRNLPKIVGQSSSLLVQKDVENSKTTLFDTNNSKSSSFSEELSISSKEDVSPRVRNTRNAKNNNLSSNSSSQESQRVRNTRTAKNNNLSTNSSSQESQKVPNTKNANNINLSSNSSPQESQRVRNTRNSNSNNLSSNSPSQESQRVRITRNSNINNLSSNSSYQESQRVRNTRNSNINNLPSNSSPQESQRVRNTRNSIINNLSSNSTSQENVRRSPRKNLNKPKNKDLEKIKPWDQSTSSSSQEDFSRCARRVPVKITKKNELTRKKTASARNSVLTTEVISTTIKNVLSEQNIRNNKVNNTSKIPVSENKLKKLRSQSTIDSDDTPENTPRTSKRKKLGLSSSSDTDSHPNKLKRKIKKKKLI